MEDSLNISETLSPKDSQINDIKTSPEENNVPKVVGREDEKTIFTESGSQEQKPDGQESLKVENGTDILDPVSSEEKTEISETSSEKLNELAKKEQFTTETSKRNSLESEKHENLLTNNTVVQDKESASSTNSQVTNLPELSHPQSEIKSSPKSSSDDHEHGSHRSPDRKSKDEYRKIKSEVTGEGETSESEGEEKDLETSKLDSEQSKDTWMDMLGNGLLKKRVIKIFKVHFNKHLSRESPLTPARSLQPPEGGGGGTWANFYWICVPGISEPLSHYSVLFGQLLHTSCKSFCENVNFAIPT